MRPAFLLPATVPALVLVLVPLLAGCATNESPAQRACEAAANDDPKVKAIIIRGVGNPHAQLEDQTLLRDAKADATFRCLRGRGVIPRGGVERQKPI